MSKMRRLLLASGLALALGVAISATAVAQQGGGQEKVTLCHATGTGGYVEISVAAPAVPAHLAHGDVHPDQYGDCPGGGEGPGGFVRSFFVQFFRAFWAWLTMVFALRF